MSSHEAAMLDETGIFGVFAAFELDPEREDESTGNSRGEIEELLADYEGEALLDTYLTAGLAGETDYLLRVHARELHTAQAFVQDFQKTRLGRRSRRTETFVGAIREAVYTPETPDLDAELSDRSYEGPDPPRYAITIPVRKTAEWWTLSAEERLDRMREHIEPMIEYLDRVRRQLYHASGLSDVDFLTYFETDDLLAFQDLYRELQSIPEYRYVEYDDPTLVGRICEPTVSLGRALD
jgi:chlorite dismutase